MNIEEQKLQFDSIEKFYLWKEDEEKKTSSYYIRQSSTKTLKEGDVKYFVCNRTGNPRFRGLGKRSLKTQGSNKSGASCTARMKVTISNSTGVVTVEYCSTHTGHSIGLGHLPIPTVTKQEIICKLQAGVSMDRILDDIREDIEGSVQRHHLVTKVDVRNIKAKLNLESIMKHPNDAISTRTWVKQMKDMVYNPVLLFKCQGDEQSEFAISK